VAGVDVPQARQAVEVFAPLGVGEHRPLPLDPDVGRRVVVGVVQRVEQMGAVVGNEVGGGPGGHERVLLGGMRNAGEIATSHRRRY
jgi:hypothetical protein